MKKQILLLAMVTMALLFAGTNNVFGQTYIDYVQGTPGAVIATPLTCTTTATTAPELNPTPGVTYTYSITTNPGEVESVHWFVTDQNNIISVVENAPTLQAIRDQDGGGGEYILDAEDGVYNVAGDAKEIDISWKNFDGDANEVVLVAYVSGAEGCSDNVQIWRIQPVFNFTIDVISMFDNGSLGTSTEPAFECVSPIESATYDGENLTVNYGQNWIFFSVTAANFVHSWQPTITAETLNGAVNTIQWAYIADAGSDDPLDWHAITDPVLASAAATDGIVGEDGESIVVRVQILNAADEAPVGATANTVTLNIDGRMYDPIAANYANTTLQDMDNGAADCVNDYTDTADYTINPRPQVIEANPTTATGPFEPKNP